MPIHDWGKAPDGAFHHFHQKWMASLCDFLNDGVLPSDLMALIDSPALGFVPDIFAVTNSPHSTSGGRRKGTLIAPPKTRYVSLHSKSQQSEASILAARANRVAVRTKFGDLIAIVELVSPGNKDGQKSIRKFRDKTVEFLNRGVHVSIIDIHPPTARDPQGIHKVIWDEIREEPFELPADKPLTVASYVADPINDAYVELVAVGDPLPPMPIFLDAETYVLAPLEESYMSTWNKCPAAYRAFVEGRPLL